MVCRAAGLCLFGGKIGCGLGFGEPETGELSRGLLLMYLGSWFQRPPHGAMWRGRALGMARWRYVAWHTLMSLGNVSRRGGDGHVPVPNPVGCRARPGAHPGHCSGLGSTWPASYSTLWAVEWGRSSPIRVRSTAQGQSQPIPFTGTLRQLGPRSLHSSSGASPLSHTPSRLHSSTWWHRGEILPQTIFSHVPAGN